jgi:hypothetical protein
MSITNKLMQRDKYEKGRYSEPELISGIKSNVIKYSDSIISRRTPSLYRVRE